MKLLIVALFCAYSTNSDVYRQCDPPEHYKLGPRCDHTILTGTTCDLNFKCPENKFSNPVSRTCQQDGTWTGDQPWDPNCHDINCPDQEGYQAFETGGCSGQDNLGTFFGPLEECAQRCKNDMSCASFEYSKPWDNHPEPNRCALSTTCTYDESTQTLNDQNCLYVKGLNISTHDSAHSESSPFIHCPLPDHYISTCDGNIIVGTSCELFYLCPERQYSIRALRTCLANSTWHGEPLDPNCYDSKEPSVTPTQNPSPQITLPEVIDDVEESDDNSTSNNSMLIPILVLVALIIVIGIICNWGKLIDKWRKSENRQIQPTIDTGVQVKLVGFSKRSDLKGTSGVVREANVKPGVHAVQLETGEVHHVHEKMLKILGDPPSQNGEALDLLNDVVEICPENMKRIDSAIHVNGSGTAWCMDVSPEGSGTGRPFPPGFQVEGSNGRTIAEKSKTNSTHNIDPTIDTGVQVKLVGFSNRSDLNGTSGGVLEANIKSGVHAVQQETGKVLRDPVQLSEESGEKVNADDKQAKRPLRKKSKSTRDSMVEMLEPREIPSQTAPKPSLSSRPNPRLRYSRSLTCIASKPSFSSRPNSLRRAQTTFMAPKQNKQKSEDSGEKVSAVSLGHSVQVSSSEDEESSYDEGHVFTT